MGTIIRTLVADELVAAASLAATASPQEVLEELRAADREPAGIPVQGLVLDLGQGEFHETGNHEIYEKASHTAEKNGVDISALTDLRED